MPLLNELNPNELFRFMNVRGPQKKPSSGSTAHLFVPLVHDVLPEKQLATIAKDRRLLYPELSALNGKAEQMSGSLKLVAAYKAGPDFLATPEAFAKAYPALTAFIDWLDAHADTATSKEVQGKFQSLHKQTFEAHAATPEFAVAKVILWDNLLANLLGATESVLVTLACKYLGTLNLIEVVPIDASAGETPGRVYRARPLVPKWIFGLAARVERQPDAGVNDQTRTPDASLDELKAKFKIAVSTGEELRGLLAKSKKRATDRQAVENKKARTPTVAGSRVPEKVEATGPREQPLTGNVPDPLTLGPDDVKTLSAPALACLGSLAGPAETYDLHQVIPLVHRHAAGLGAQIGARSLRQSVKVGGAIVDSSDFCADLTEEDPCGRAPRKEFAAGGSYVGSALIGDLLVTKQQLIKYDLGEVAHVESVMVGLEKTRTHRRLNRTETTDLTEREATTETEHETQTTDRFDMEKESSRALAQDFQVDAGVNVSGSYGTVKFSSTLDSSFGTSSQQTQADATTFSKTVTNRALSRVKERVRQQKTVTVINETEETSINKLANNTGDNVNGVYRWLDKFYLNKIINYGSRLMFEFTVPEPAQFYIFRQVAKPKPGAAVENPLDPTTVVDPLGLSLHSPASLNDDNYAFWAALYGASIAAPPEEFLRVSKAWKNQGATSQSGDVYESFASSFTVNAGYEAIHADLAYYWNYWGTGSVVGNVGTAWFASPGNTASLALPGITTEVGVVISVQGMYWTLTITLTQQRSAKLLGDWQSESYGKIIDAYRAKQRDYQAWVDAQSGGFGDVSAIGGNNPAINRDTEREELKKRCLELFTGQRFESFDAAVNGIYNRSNYPEILFAESIREGNLVKFFEQAFDWANLTYIFYPYMWGRKANWVRTKLIEDPSDPLFTKFLQAGAARVVVPARPGFENYLMMFHLLAGLISDLGCSWNFQPSLFGSLGISNTFSPAVNDPTYMSIAEELASAAGYTDEVGPIHGTPYVQKVPTNLVYVAQNNHAPNTPWPGLPDNSADPDIAPYL
jgi:hypothetical protein